MLISKVVTLANELVHSLHLKQSGLEQLLKCVDKLFIYIQIYDCNIIVSICTKTESHLLFSDKSLEGFL